MADPVTLMLISAGASVVGGGLAAAGTIAQGNANYAAAKAEQKNLNKMAAEEMAVSTRNADAKAREARLIQSRGQAVAAASGAGALDPTVLDIMGNVARDANVQERDLLREGQVKANDLTYRGKVGVANARTAKGIGTILAAGQVASGVSDAFSKYGSGLPSSPPTSSGAPWYL